MSVISRITLRQMKENKRRTLVTLIGIILSVTMVTAVATVVFSFLNMMQQSKIAENGNWHVAYSKVNGEQVRQIRADAATQTMLLSRRSGYARFYASQNRSRPYLYVREYNTAAFKNFPVSLREGRFPQAPGEIALARSAVEDSGVGVGERLHLEIGGRYTQGGESVPGGIGYNQYNGEPETIRPSTVRDYTVVGILETPGFEGDRDVGYTAIAYLDEAALSPADHVTASVLMSPMDRFLFTRASGLAQRIEASPEFHTSLLQYYGLMGNGTTYRVLMEMVLILVFIILAGSAALIHNAFSISLSQRGRQLGILASVGATKRQMRQSVLFEGLVLGLTAIPIGLLAGTVGIGVTFRLLGTYIQSIFDAQAPLRLIVSPASILASISLAAVVILFSVWAPARRAARITPMEAIRQSKEQRIQKNFWKRENGHSGYGESKGCWRSKTAGAAPGSIARLCCR